MEVAQGRVVHVGHAPLPIEGVETVGNAVDYGRQPRLGVVQRLLGLLALADVVARLENPLDSILVAHKLHADGNRERPALLGATDQLPFPLADPGQDGVHLGHGGRAEGLQELMDVLAQSLLLGEAVEFLGAVVPELDLPAQAAYVDGVLG